MHTNGRHGSYEAQLAPELASVVVARRLLGRAAHAWGLAESASQDAALAVSELVSNSVLHAGTQVRVCISRLGPGVRISVEDGDPHIPVVDAARPEDLLSNRSMTGRGLALVAAASDRWGADPCGSGKVTWAEVGTGRRVVEPAPPPNFPPAPAPPDIPAAARARGVTTQSAVTGAGRRVHLVGVPVALLLDSIQQLSDLHREMQVMVMGRSSSDELEPVVQAGRPWITDIDLWADSDRRVAESALAAGADTVDFEVVVPDDIVTKVEGVAAWLRRAAASISRRQLLTLPASAEVTAYRRWYGEEILRQVAGGQPTPCPVRVRART